MVDAFSSCRSVGILDLKRAASNLKIAKKEAKILKLGFSKKMSA